MLKNIHGKGIEQNNQWSLKTVSNPSWFDRLQFSIQIVLISNDCILGLISSHAKFQKPKNQTKIEGILMGLKWWHLQRSCLTRFLTTPKKLYFCELWQMAVQNNLIPFWAIEQPNIHNKKNHYVHYKNWLPETIKIGTIL